MKKIFNAKGEEVLLNAREKMGADRLTKAINALGYQVDITTLTTIMKRISEQKFFEIAPADYVPVRVGEGAWSSQLLTYRSYAIGDDFATGVINTGGNNARLATADAGVDSVALAVKNWAKSIGWTLFEVQQATVSGNWDLISQKEKSRKKNWDLGIQKVAFLGLAGDASALGLLNQAGITNNTALITGALKAMTGAQLSAFLGGLLDAYRVNCSRTAWPTHFVIPESDYLGLATPSDPNFPLKSKLALIEETLQTLTKRKDFKVLPCAYGDQANSGLGVQRYAMYNADEDSIRMDIPVDYNSTLANSNDSFSFQNVGYGQFTGVMAYRPAELMYFSY